MKEWLITWYADLCEIKPVVWLMFSVLSYLLGWHMRDEDVKVDKAQKEFDDEDKPGH